MDNSVKIIQWDGIKSVFLIALLSTFGFLGFLAKGLIINYVLRFAPKNRPINTLIAIDQVRIIVWKISVDAKNNFVWRIFFFNFERERVIIFIDLWGSNHVYHMAPLRKKHKFLFY